MSGYPEHTMLNGAPAANLINGTCLKKCTKCGETKPLNEFHKDSKAADGQRNDCKNCTKKANRKWKQANPEKAKESCRKWRTANPERVKEDCRKRYAANKDKAKEYARARRAANPEKAKEQKRKWYVANKDKENKRCHKWRKANPGKAAEASRKWGEANPERVKENMQKWRAANIEHRAIYQRNREARKNEAEGSHTEKDINEMYLQQGGQCNVCGKKLVRYRKKQYHVDHIVPLSKGGGNGPDNLQLLCPFCNISKKDKDPVQWAREKGRLF